MFQECNDQEVFKIFWRNEKDCTPRWFNDGSQTWHCSESDFLEFCANSWKVFCVDNTALVYVEKDGVCANVHLSILRGSDASDLLENLIKLRNELLKDFELLYAWVCTRDRGLKRLMDGLGFSWYGFTMIHGTTHGKVMEWKNYSISRRELFLAKDTRKLLVSV